jgi:hypothetical protein
MAFGFPAYHSETFASSGTANLRAAVTDSLEALGWPVRTNEATRIIAATGMGVRSFGEKLVIEFVGPESVAITSRCALVTQCLDWGKNKSNVEKLCTELGRRA